MQVLSTHTRTVGVFLFVLLFLYTLFLLRSNRLSPQHAMSWIIAELAMLVLMVSDAASLFIVRLVGADNALSAIFLLATIWGVLLMLDLLVRISELNAKLRAVNQELALLGERFEKLEQSLITADSKDH
ncbi:MAG: DUF2304 domain-containing protein [Chloroflexi bacterium]|nr:MAG: DUF2304 domain-containing protein [Chloroflexota bacterium]